jgi:hypothetical protein
MSIISLFVYAAVVFGIAYLARCLLKTRAWRRALEKQWKKSKLDLISTSVGLVSMLFFFSAILCRGYGMQQSLHRSSHLS